MLASGAFRGGYKRPTAILRDPVPALSADFDLLSPTPGPVRNQCDGPLSVADKRELLVLTPEAIRRPKGGGLDVPRHSQENLVLLRTP